MPPKHNKNHRWKWQIPFSGTLALLLLIFLGENFLVLHREQTKPWRQYQQAYYKQQNTRDSARVRIISITPTLTGKPELCLTCHTGIEEISSSHPTESFGCVLCHGGDGQTLDKDAAHATLRGGGNPSELSVARQSCGSSPDGTACHDGFTGGQSWKNMVDRVQRSLPATEAGAITHLQYTFGILPHPDPVYGTRTVTDDSVAHPGFPEKLTALADKLARDSAAGTLHPVEKQMQANCLDGGCHLNTAGVNKEYFHRSQGCATCHVLYEQDGLYKGNDVTISHTEPGHGRVHQFTVAIPYSQCNHCHNRGIYSMKQMAFLERNDLTPDLEFESVQTQRQEDYYIPMAEYTQCEVDLDCIDCHTHNEIMGDGDIQPNKKAAVEVECQTCHGTVKSPPTYRVISSLDEEDVFMDDLNPYLTPAVGDTVAVTREGTLLTSVKKVNGQWQQISKVDGTVYPVPESLGSGCKQDVNKQDSNSCHACHDASKERS